MKNQDVTVINVMGLLAVLKNGMTQITTFPVNVDLQKNIENFVSTNNLVVVHNDFKF